MAGNCKSFTIDFVLLDSDPFMAAVEDDIKADLAKIGITVNTQFLPRDEYIERERNGEYNMLFSRTWGAPYDPHSYLSSWAVPSHVEYTAIANLEPPITRESLVADLEQVQTELDPTSAQTKWRKILDDVHQQAIFLPLWGSRSPYVTNRRLNGFAPGNQAYTYPLAGVRISTGSNNVTVAPGSGGSLFKSVGPMNPHQYFPNQLFASDWIYEGLVRYGQEGEIVPALATEWTTENTDEGQKVTFKLREGVKFHDGSEWNCSVAKLNFDHILSDVVKERHSWYGTPQKLKSWVCDENGNFVLETSTPYYPLLQELTYTRPLVFASPAAFAQGLDSDPDQHNSCEPGQFGSKWNYLEESITCAGLKAPVGTGPFRFVEREYLPGSGDTIDQTVVFARHDDYWGGAPEIEFLKVLHFENSEEVEAALRSNTLDMVLGTGPLSSEQVQNLKFFDSDKFDVRQSGVLQNALVVMNSGKAPTDDINVRKAIIHAVNKAVFIEKEFGGLEQPVSQLLPLSTPFSNIDLNPKWNYDLDKAHFLNCPVSAEATSELSGGAIAGIVVVAVAAVGLVGLIARLIVREKQGTPMFSPSEKAEQA